MKKYNLILTAMLAIALCFTACSNDNNDANQNKIEVAQKRVAAAENEWRAAYKYGVENPYNARGGFDYKLSYAANGQLVKTRDSITYTEAAYIGFMNDYPGHPNEVALWSAVLMARQALVEYAKLDALIVN